MGLLSEDMRTKALLKIKTAEVKGKKGRSLRFLERAMNKLLRLSNQAGKQAQTHMDERKLVWKQYTTRKQEFAKDVEPHIAKGHYDFILCHDSKAIAPALKAAKVHKAVLGFDLVEMTFANLRGFKPSTRTKRKLRQMETQIAKADFMISGDPYLSQEFQTRHPKVAPVLILNGQETDLPPINVSLRERMGDETDRPIVLYIGVIAINRGIEQIIDAMAQVKTDCLLALVGPGNPAYRTKIQDQIAALNLGDRIHLLDGVEQSEVIPLSSTATIGISPISLKTGNAGLVLNNKMFQYIAAGLPVLSTDVPGPGGFIKKHEVGYIYQDEDAASLASTIDVALNEMNEDAPIKQRLKDVATQYSWESQRQVLQEYIIATETKHGLAQQNNRPNDGTNHDK